MSQSHQCSKKDLQATKEGHARAYQATMGTQGRRDRECGGDVNSILAGTKSCDYSCPAMQKTEIWPNPHTTREVPTYTAWVRGGAVAKRTERNWVLESTLQPVFMGPGTCRRDTSKSRGNVRE